MILKATFIFALATHGFADLNLLETFDQANFVYVHGGSTKIHTRYALNNVSSLLTHQRFDWNRKTLLFCHGWIDDFESDAIQTIAESYIKRNDHNIIILDWGQYSFTVLHSAVIRSSIIAKHAGKSLTKLFQFGLESNKFHCVGHSIGAHICGIIGREVIRLSSGQHKLKRITALDAAFPFYYPAISGLPLSYRDAEFVDAVHSDTFYVGTPYRVGHADFFPNNGKLQSGCPDLHALDVLNNFCSHFRSLRYWSESLISKKVYPAKRCKSWSDFKSQRCDNNPTNYLGYDAVHGLQGVFFNEIAGERSLIDKINSDNFHYIGTSFVKRSDLTKLYNKFGKSIG